MTHRHRCGLSQLCCLLACDMYVLGQGAIDEGVSPSRMHATRCAKRLRLATCLVLPPYLPQVQAATFNVQQGDSDHQKMMALSLRPKNFADMRPHELVDYLTQAGKSEGGPC